VPHRSHSSPGNSFVFFAAGTAPHSSQAGHAALFRETNQESLASRHQTLQLSGEKISRRRNLGSRHFLLNLQKLLVSVRRSILTKQLLWELHLEGKPVPIRGTCILKFVEVQTLAYLPVYKQPMLSEVTYSFQ
jgi:hypothetical protein